jgi:hypothetical protein
MGEMRNADNILVGKSEGKRPPARPIRKLEDNIKMDFTEIGREVVDWIHLAQDKDQWQALINTVIELWVPKKVGEEEFLE